MKVAMLTYSTRARGGVAHALKLAERLRLIGVDVTLYSLARDDDEASSQVYFRSVEAPYEVFPYEWHPDVMVRLERMIDTYTTRLPADCDIYHSQDCVGGTALARMKASGVISGPVFRTVHHVDDFAEPRLFEFEKSAVALSDHRFVVSQYWKEALKEGHGLDSVVTYNGLDLDDFRDLPPRRSCEPTVLFVGGLEPRKGLEHLVLAMEGVMSSRPDARLAVVAKSGFRGVDDPAWFRTLAERAGIADRVSFMESVSQEDLLQLYADCDLLVLPSRNEGWGLSLMEAMACEKPVVATAVGGIPELVRDGVEGLLVAPGDVAALATAMVRLLADPGTRRRMGRAGIERVKSFSWDETARTTLHEYERSLQRE